MATQAGWDPLRDLLNVQKRMNELFESALARTDFDTGQDLDSWSPVCDVFETPQSLVICLELPGLSQDQIDLRLDGDELVVQGDREMDRESAGDQFHRVERSYGKFSRRFHLPSTVDRDSVEATYNAGVLRIVLSNRPETLPESVRVEINPPG